MTFTISRRIDTEKGLYTAVVWAVPQDNGAIAVVRTHDCDSREGALSLLETMAQSLRSELTARGDVELAAAFL